MGGAANDAAGPAEQGVSPLLEPEQDAALVIADQRGELREAQPVRAMASREPPNEPPTVLVLEKSASVGDHMLSGGVMNPRAIRELVPDFPEQGFPTEYVCNYAGFWLFHPKGKLSIAPVPPNFRKKGYHVVSLNKV